MTEVAAESRTPIGAAVATSIAPRTDVIAARAPGLGARVDRLVERCLSRHALPAVDGVRAVAAALVFVVHYQAAFGRLLVGRPVLYRAADYAADIGYHGVTVFFVLSGFLIYGSLVGKPVAYGEFFRRRVQRIYPTFLVVLVLYLLLGTIFHSRSKLPATNVVAYVLANAALLPGVAPIRPIITVAWSLSYEVCFYLGLGLAAAALRLRVWSRRARLAMLAVLALTWAIGGEPVQGTVRSFIMFLPGLVIWELWSARRQRLRTTGATTPAPPGASGWLVWVAFVGILLVVPAVSRAAVAERLTAVGLAPSSLTFALLVAGVSPLLWQALVNSRRGVASVLAARPLRFLGAISYSFYLIHGLTINALALVLAPAMNAVGPAGGVLLYLGLFVPTYLAATVVATTLFVTVEQRFSL